MGMVHVNPRSGCARRLTRARAVGIAPHLSHTGKLIRIHTDRKSFEDAVVAAGMRDTR